MDQVGFRGDTLVVSNRGLYCLDELFEKGMESKTIQVSTDENKTEFVTSLKKHNKQETRKIVTEDGLEIEGALQQRVRVLQDGVCVWKSLDELKVGDKLITRFGGHPRDADLIPLIKIDKPLKQPDFLTPEVAKFMGILMGGGVTKKDENSIIVKKTSFPLNSFLDHVFNIRTITEQKETVLIENKYLYEWVELICRFDCGRLPTFIRHAPHAMAREFIDGYDKSSLLINPTSSFQQEFLQLCRSCNMNLSFGFIQHLKILSEGSKCTFYGSYRLDRVTSIQSSESETYSLQLESGHTCCISSIVANF